MCVHASVCVLVNVCVGVGVTPPETAGQVVDPSEINDEKSVGSVTGLHPRLAPQTVRRH